VNNSSNYNINKIGAYTFSVIGVLIKRY